MAQPTQKLLPVRKTRSSDTPLQASAANSSGGRLSFPASDEVECPLDQARQPVTTTDFSWARTCPPPRGLTMTHESRVTKQEGRPETAISRTPLIA